MADNHIYLACAHCGKVTVFERALRSWRICTDTGHVVDDNGEPVLWTEAKEALSGDIGIAATDETWNLIAASPDMHAALEAQAARDAHGRWNCTSCLCDDVECSVKVKLDAEALRLREAALAKAKGQ